MRVLQYARLLGSPCSKELRSRMVKGTVKYTKVYYTNKLPIHFTQFAI